MPSLKLLVFSDVHGRIAPAKRLLRAVRAQRFDAVICAGDLGPLDRARSLAALFAHLKAPFLYVQGNHVSEAAGEGTKMADHLSPIFRPAFPSSAIISERSSPSRVRYAAPNNGAPLTAPGRSGQHF
jgi:predicted phosphodiesterase